MKNNEILAGKISEQDEEALKFLKDIHCSRRIDPKGFKLEFLFDTNPFFRNFVLTMIYYMMDDDVPEYAIGTHIEWYPGKCLMHKILKKKPIRGLKDAKPIIRTVDCESFFKYFTLFKPPPRSLEDYYDIDSDTKRRLTNQMEQDFEKIGSIFRDKIIPEAVFWFTGEAAGLLPKQMEMEGEEDEDGEDYAGEEGEKCVKKVSFHFL